MMLKENNIDKKESNPYVCISLRFIGSNFNPEEITNLVKINPTHSKQYGIKQTTSSGKTFIPKNSAWSFDKNIKYDNLESEINIFLNQIENIDLQKHPKGVEKIFIDILFIVENNEFGCASHEFFITPYILNRISNLGISLCISFESETSKSTTL